MAWRWPACTTCDGGAEMELKGTLERQFFGGEVWVLNTAAGVYHLKGKIPEKLEGKQVRVKGAPAATDVSFSMVGEIFDVKRIEKA